MFGMRMWAQKGKFLVSPLGATRGPCERLPQAKPYIVNRDATDLR